MIHRVPCFIGGLLPGQIPVSSITNPTPAGQPYGIAPWNYTGTSLENSFAGPYHPDVVDWLLISFRSTIDPATEFKKAAALLYKDGHIEFVESCVFKTSSINSTSAYVAIEHWNHIGIGTPVPIDFSNGSLSFDFRIQQSYDVGLGFGQKEISNGTFVMYAGDCDQESDIISYDITSSDNACLNINNGIFDTYFSRGDFNLNGNADGSDRILWGINNGVSSRWPK